MTDRPHFLFAGESCKNLAKFIESHGVPMGDIYHHTFPSQEKYCQFKTNIRGADVFLLQTLCNPANDNLMQLLIMADAAKRASAERITAIIPYFGYARQDRKDKSRVPISAKLIMDLIAAAGINRIVTMDLHAPQIAGFTNLPCDHLYFQPVLAEAVKNLNIDVVVAPDIGAVKRVSEYAQREKLDIAFIVKKRLSDTDVELSHFVGDIKGKNVLILDDLTESAGTLVMAAKICREKEAAHVYSAVTHASLTDIGIVRLNKAISDGIIDRFFCSDTVTPNVVKNCYCPFAGVTVSVSKLFAETINCIHENRSVTSLFK